MGDSFIGFEPSFPKHWKMPPSYGVWGATDELGSFYHWFVEAVEYGAEWPFGDNCKTKTEAYRQAWNHYRGVAP